MRDLTAAEAERLCAWTVEVANARLPQEGTEIICDGERMAFARGRPNCGSYKSITEDCPVTVAEVKRCYPDLFAYVAANPCPWMRLDSGDAYADFVSRVPSCAKYPACLYSDDEEP